MALRGKWTREEVEALGALQLRALKKNAERARDDMVASWCDEAIQRRTQQLKSTGSLLEEGDEEVAVRGMVSR